jgi:prepilin-type N-terminal cleavage/methylation domain-containing protein
MRGRRGFTLAELIIVIVVFAIALSLIVVGARSGRHASNERSSTSSLKTLASAEADFRGNDRDGNKVQDFWTRDVAGLYGVVPVGSTEMIKLIELSVAGADFAAAGTAGLGVTGLEEVDLVHYTVTSPKAGYWFQAMRTDEESLPYRTDTEGGVRQKSWWNHAKFGFYHFPDSFSAGRNVFFINEGNTIFKRSMAGPVKSPSAVPNPAGIVLRVATDALTGTQPAEAWPADAVLKAEYGKLD